MNTVKTKLVDCGKPGLSGATVMKGDAGKYMVIQNMVRTHEGKQVFNRILKIRFVTALDVT